MKQRKIKPVESREQKFLTILPDPIRHLIIAQNKLSAVIIDAREFCGRNNLNFTRICEAQSEIGLALQNWEKMKEKSGEK